MTLLEEKSSYRGDNKIENWRSFDNYLNLIEDAPAQSEQFCGFRKSKSDSELSKCTCALDMGSQSSRPKSFHNFEMLEQNQNAIKKPSLPDTSDFSEDDYQPLDSTDDELQTPDEASQSTLTEHNRRSTDHVLDSRSIENQTSDESETQSGGLNFFSSQTNFIAGCSKNNKCASLRDSSFDKPHPHSESNDNECENIVGSSDALKTDSILKCMTLPKIKSDPRSSVRRSLRTAADRGSAGNKNFDEISEAQLRRSLKALKSMRSLLHQPLKDESAALTTELTHEAVPQCASDPDVFNVLLTEQQLSADLDRPRQYGRRSNPVRISSFAIESSDNGAAVSRYFIIVDQLMRAN